MNDCAHELLDTSEPATLAAQRARLAADVEATAALPGIDTAALAALREKLAGKLFNLVVAGEFKRGKSSVINALLAAEVLPTGVVPLTSIVTVLRHGASPSAEVVFEGGRREAIALEHVADYVTERGNPQNAKHVREVEVAYPAPWLAHGFRIVDTPGIGSAYQHNTDVTRAYLPQADAVVFVASVEQPVSQSELDFLAGIRACASKIFCLLNKTDYVTQAELAESVAYSTAVLREALGTDVPVFPVSARRALEARRQGAGGTFAASGFAPFDTALQGFFANDSAAVWVGSVRRRLTRLLSEFRLTVDLERKAIDAPLASLDENLHAFTGKKAEVLQARADGEALLHADANRLVKERLDPDMESLRHELTGRFDRAVPDWLAAAVAQHALPRRVALEQRIASEVRAAFDAWRTREDDVINDAFERVCDRFQTRISQLVDELLHYSAGLFAVRFDTVAAEPFRQVHSRFYYKFWEEPTGLRMTTDALRDLVPGSLGRALLLKHARRRTAELVDTQAGRVHYDIRRRIEHAAHAALRDLLGRFDATTSSIESAIAKGRELRSRGEHAANTRRRELDILLARIDAITEHASAPG